MPQIALLVDLSYLLHFMSPQIFLKTSQPGSPKQESDLFTWLHDKVFYLDGIHGTFERFNPGERQGYARLYHNPSAQGRQTDHYKIMKRELGDDWVTDLTDNIERYVATAINLGYCFDEDENAPAPPV
jgi:hypothetical protein